MKILASVLTIAASVALLPAGFAQMSGSTAKKPMLSPPAKASVELDGKQVTIDYNTPFMRGRKIFGGLVPYDKVWRTGANPATTLKTAVELEDWHCNRSCRHLHSVYAALRDHLEADHQQADRPMGNGLQRIAGPGPRRYAEEHAASTPGKDEHQL